MLAARFRRKQLDAEAERKIAKAVLEARDDAPAHPNASLPGDTRKLRGIPAIGYGVGGAIPGTRPGDGLE